jgi:hypothetical protein
VLALVHTEVYATRLIFERRSLLYVTMIGPNFSADHDSRQPMFLITTGILVLLSTVAVALRQVPAIFAYVKVLFVDHLVGFTAAFFASATLGSTIISWLLPFLSQLVWQS